MSRFRLIEQAKADIRAIWDYFGRVKESPSAAASQIEILFEGKGNSRAY
jgi:plasmid stabilization system protein ParE